MTYVLGQTVELAYTTTPGETGTLTVTRPDGTTLSPTVTGAAGSQTALLDADQAGVWTYVWESANAGRRAGAFTVGQPVVTLGEVKTHLNIPASDTSQDAELASFIDAAVAVVEDAVGPISPVVKTATVTGSLLPDSPIVSIDTVSSGSVTVPYTANLDAGLIYTNSYLPVTVTYTAGRAVVPSAIRLAVLVVIDRLWQTQRGAQPLPVAGGDDTSYVPQGGPDLPYQAQMLLRPYLRGATVA